MSKEMFLSDAAKDGSMGKWFATLGGAAAALTAVAAAKPWGRVPEGYVGLREKYDAIKRDRDGNMKNKVVPPGLRYKAPFKGVLKLVDIRTQATDLDDISVARNGELWTIKPTLFWRVPWDEENIYNFLYRASGSDDRSQIITAICNDALAQIYETLPDENLFNRGLVDAKLYNQCADEVHTYGIELMDLKLRGITPNPVERLRSGMIESAQPIPPANVLASVTEITEVAS